MERAGIKSELEDGAKMPALHPFEIHSVSPGEAEVHLRKASEDSRDWWGGFHREPPSRCLVADISRARVVLGYVPRVSVERGIAELLGFDEARLTEVSNISEGMMG